MKNANTTWTMTSYENGEPTEVRHGLSRDEAVEAIYRAMGGWYPGWREAAEPVEPRRHPDTRELETVAA